VFHFRHHFCFSESVVATRFMKCRPRHFVEYPATVRLSRLGRVCASDTGFPSSSSPWSRPSSLLSASLTTGSAVRPTTIEDQVSISPIITILRAAFSYESVLSSIYLNRVNSNNTGHFFGPLLTLPYLLCDMIFSFKMINSGFNVLNNLDKTVFSKVLLYF